jgi:hypothetical protein
MHTLLLKSPLPNIVVATARSDINIAAIDVKSATTPKCFDLLFISAKQGMFRYWQDMFNPYPEGTTPAFCAES